MALRGKPVMTDDRLMAMARAAGYSMIPPQDAIEAEQDGETASPDSRANAGTDASSLHRLRGWIGQSAVPVLAMRDAVTNWYHGRAHA